VPTSASKTGTRFRGWYVNVLAPCLRTEYGFDVVDRTLDLVVRADRSWYWKDEDELDLAVEKQACSRALARTIRQAGQEALSLLLAKLEPFNEQWTDWRAPAGWAIADFPDGWQSLPALIPDGAFEHRLPERERDAV
jgi:hypothetical protein